MAIHNSPGRGRKQCSSCNKYVGVRSRTCENCNTEFSSTHKSKPESKSKPKSKPEFKSSKAKVLGESFASSIAMFEQRISTPAGRCPVRLKSADENDVQEWIDKIRSHGKGMGKHYSNSALRYFVREFFSYHTVEYAQIAAMIPDREISSAMVSD